MRDVPMENPNLAGLESSVWEGRWRPDCVGRRKGLKEEGSLKEVVFKGDRLRDNCNNKNIDRIHIQLKKSSPQRCHQVPSTMNLKRLLPQYSTHNNCVKEALKSFQGGGGGGPTQGPGMSATWEQLPEPGLCDCPVSPTNPLLSHGEGDGTISRVGHGCTGDTGCVVSKHSGGGEGRQGGEENTDFLTLKAKENVFQKPSENHFHA